MKHRVLTSVAHNVADSLASGIGMMIGIYEMDVFGEAARSREGFIEVDFLTGRTAGGKPSRKLERAIELYVKALPQLCERQGVSISDFRSLTVRYDRGSARSFVVQIEDRRGKVSRDRYVGAPGARPKTLDPLGRIRRTRSA